MRKPRHREDNKLLKVTHQGSGRLQFFFVLFFVFLCFFFKKELPPLLGAKMATVPGGTARSSQRATSLSQPPLRCDDGKQEGGGADDLGRSRAQRPPARAPAPPSAPASRQGALAGPGGARWLPGYSARPASPPGLRCGREIRVFSKMVALGSGWLQER
jgi:hypothetical protein